MIAACHSRLLATSVMRERHPLSLAQRLAIIFNHPGWHSCDTKTGRVYINAVRCLLVCTPCIFSIGSNIHIGVDKQIKLKETVSVSRTGAEIWCVTGLVMVSHSSYFISLFDHIPTVRRSSSLLKELSQQTMGR